MAGWLLVAAGLAGLLTCVRAFFVTGRGTLAPWDPPQCLVAVGLYRFTRNPMYVSIIILLAGWSLAAGSTVLGIYAPCLAVAFHLRVVLHEEPWLRRNFPEAWASYAARVPRWLGMTRKAPKQPARFPVPATTGSPLTGRVIAPDFLRLAPFCPADGPTAPILAPLLMKQH